MLSCLVLGCAHAALIRPPATAPPAAKLFPLAVGNRWTYRVQFLGADQLLSVSIVSGEPGTFVDNRGQRYHVERDGIRDDRRYLLRDPLGPGKGWSSVISLTDTEAYQVAGINESIVVPAGHFSGCVRVAGRNPGAGNAVQLAEQVYCPGVGLVRVTTYEEIGGRRSPPQWSEELVAYRLQG